MWSRNHTIKHDNLYMKESYYHIILNVKERLQPWPWCHNIPSNCPSFPTHFHSKNFERTDLIIFTIYLDKGKTQDTSPKLIIPSQIQLIPYPWELLSFLLHIIFVIPMTVNDVNLSVSFRGVSGLSSWREKGEELFLRKEVAFSYVKTL